MRKFYFLLKSILVFSFAIIFNYHCLGQNYGLGFSSHEVHQDKRTTLNITSENELCFSENFDISFELSFVENRDVYFGYIVRIIDNKGRNYDLVYNTAKDHFNLIVGDSLSGVSFNIPRVKLYRNWNKFTLKFDMLKCQVKVLANGQEYVQNKISIKKNSCYKIVFGANRFEPFETTDIPPMKVRNVRIFEKDKLQYDWPLHEVGGDIAYDLVKNRKAAVSNPSWQTALHSKWDKQKPLIAKGIASVAFDAKEELIYITASDTIYKYSVRNSRWEKNAYSSHVNLNEGNRSFFNPLNGELYNYFLGRETAGSYNFKNGRTEGEYLPGDVTGYWHCNKMFSKVDTSLYVFGGYGYLLYRNKVRKYSFNTHKWSDLKNKGDFFTPRYLAGLGSTSKGDTAYILGGYGNASGQQILNPKNLYDMMRYTVKDQTFKKMFDLKINREDFALANSLVLDENKGLYYGLIFPRHKYNSSLQLVRGSLKKPTFQLLGSIIPYSFHDVHSFADLYYCQKSKKFVAVTLLRTDNGKTVVNIFTLLGPPYFGSDKALPEKTNNTWYYLLAAGCMVAGVFLWYFKRKEKNGVVPQVTYNTLPQEAAHHHHDLAELSEMELAGQNETKSNASPSFKNAILLFGDLQVFDAAGTSITKLFTPLIKELFLLILLHSVKLGRGVSSDKLNEMFWFDKSEKSARNNRSVAIVKLKSLLDKLDHCKLSKDSGYWMLEIDYNHFYVDYHSYLNIIDNRKRIDDGKIQHLSSIVQRGNFLSTSEYEWLDNFKSEIFNDIINTYLHFLQMPEHHKDPEFLIKIASYILNIDPVNEDAMILKCRSFVALGKHSLAKNAFENFVKAYKNMYDNSFDKDFHSILEKVV
jgi:two-component SAPR family response regulator